VSASSKPESSGTTRNIIIAVVVVAVLLLGYCATKVASIARTVVASTEGIRARMDTTHHVASGSAVYVGDTKVADIIKVVVIHADTSTPAAAAHGALDSTLQAGLRQETVLYSSSAPAGADATSQLGDVLLTGHVEGTYDSDAPVKITLSHRTGAATSVAPIQLVIPGRRQPISVY
jgi:hypothetical protein